MPVDLVKTRPLPASPFYLVQATGNPEVEVSRRSRRTLRQNTGGFPHNWRKQAWLLKNSVAEIAQKIRCARMPYKRFSPPGYTFLVAHFEPIFRKNGLFQYPHDFSPAIEGAVCVPEFASGGGLVPVCRRSRSDRVVSKKGRHQIQDAGQCRPAEFQLLRDRSAVEPEL